MLFGFRNIGILLLKVIFRANENHNGQCISYLQKPVFLCTGIGKGLFRQRPKEVRYSLKYKKVFFVCPYGVLNKDT